MKLKSLNYTIILQKEDEGGYTVTVPMLPGCVTYGKDIDEAKRMAKEAITLYLESLAEHNEEIPSEENAVYATLPIDLSAFNFNYA